MVGGLVPLAVTTLKVSVRHCELSDTSCVPVAELTPAFSMVTDWVDVDGPAITKFTKSRRI